MHALFSNPVYGWLFLGAALIVFEAFTAPGLGIFLGGLGAICTALLVEGGLVDAAAVPAQFACFFGLTATWAAILWKPLMKFRSAGKGDKARQYGDMIGDTATVCEPGLLRGETGRVSWSGTIMNAELDGQAAAVSLPSGARVEITSVSGNIVKVIPKQEAI